MGTKRTGSSVEIVMETHNSGKVYIDGIEQKYIRSLRFDASVDKVSVLHLDLITDEVTIIGPDVKIDYSNDIDVKELSYTPINIREGDIVVVRSEERLDMEHHVALKERLKTIFPDNQLVVLDGGIKLDVVTKSQDIDFQHIPLSCPS